MAKNIKQNGPRPAHVLPPAKKQCIRSKDDEPRSRSSSSSSIINLPTLDAQTQSAVPAQIMKIADHSNEITYFDGVPKTARNKSVIHRPSDFLAVPACDEVDEDVSEIIFFSS